MSACFETEDLTDGIAVVTITVERLMNEVQKQELKIELNSLFNGGFQRILIDFTSVRLVMSSILGVLYDFHLQKMAPAGRSFVICSIDPETLEVFQVTRLDTVFDIKPTKGAAIEAWRTAV